MFYSILQLNKKCYICTQQFSIKNIQMYRTTNMANIDRKGATFVGRAVSLI